MERTILGWDVSANAGTWHTHTHSERQWHVLAHICGQYASDWHAPVLNLPGGLKEKAKADVRESTAKAAHTVRSIRMPAVALVWLLSPCRMCCVEVEWEGRSCAHSVARIVTAQLMVCLCFRWCVVT